MRVQTFFVLCVLVIAEATGFAVWSYLPLLGGSGTAVWLGEFGHRDLAVGAAVLGILLQVVSLLLAKRRKAARGQVFLDD